MTCIFMPLNVFHPKENITKNKLRRERLRKRNEILIREKEDENEELRISIEFILK